MKLAISVKTNFICVMRFVSDQTAHLHYNCFFIRIKCRIDRVKLKEYQRKKNTSNAERYD